MPQTKDDKKCNGESELPAVSPLTRLFCGFSALVALGLFILFLGVPILLVFQIPGLGWLAIAFGSKDVDSLPFWLLSTVCTLVAAAFSVFLILNDDHVMLSDPSVVVIFLLIVAVFAGSTWTLCLKIQSGRPKKHH